MEREEREVRRLLREAGARLKRKNASHEIYVLPSQQMHVLSRNFRWREWRNNLAELRRKV